MGVRRSDPGAVRPDVGQRKGHGETEDAGANLLQHDRAEDEVEGWRIFQRTPVVMGIQVDMPEAENQRQRLQCGKQRTPELPEFRRADPEIMVGIAQQAGQPDHGHAPEHGIAYAFDIRAKHQHQQKTDQADVDHFPDAFHPVMHHVPAEVFAHVQAIDGKQAEQPDGSQGQHAQPQSPVNFVPAADGWKRAQHHVTQDGKTDQDHDIRQATGFKIFQPFVQPGLPQPPAGDALLGQGLRGDVPDHHGNQRNEKKLDQAGRGQFAFRE